MFHICSHYEKRVNRSLVAGEEREGWTSELFAISPVNTTLLPRSRFCALQKNCPAKREAQVMRQVTPTLRLPQTSCEQDEKGGSMDQLPRY
jgi:hypothetical protein